MTREQALEYYQTHCLCIRRSHYPACPPRPVKRTHYRQFREAQQEAATTRHRYEEQWRREASMPRIPQDDGSVVDTATGEVVATAEEVNATQIANADAAADQEMFDLLDREAVAWRPEPGDKLTGVVIDTYERDGDYGPYRVVEICTASGALIAFHAFHQAAATQVKRTNPRPGDRIAVKRGSDIPSKTKGHADYANFVVKVRRVEPAS